MIRWMIRAVPVVALAVSVAHAGTQDEVVATEVPAASKEFRSIDPKTQAVEELRMQVDELKRTLSELRTEVSQVPQYLDQGDSPVTGP